MLSLFKASYNIAMKILRTDYMSGGNKAKGSNTINNALHKYVMAPELIPNLIPTLEINILSHDEDGLMLVQPPVRREITSW